MEKSFYDLDYIIEIGEKRVELYRSAYQNILGRLPHIILIYSAVSIYLMPIIQDIMDGAPLNYVLVSVIFLGTIISSLKYTIQLLIPAETAVLEPSHNYYGRYRQQYEDFFLSPDMTEEKLKEMKKRIDNYLKATYIIELRKVQTINYNAVKHKDRLYYKALIWALIALIPYTTCVVSHLNKKVEKAKDSVHDEKLIDYFIKYSYA